MSKVKSTPFSFFSRTGVLLAAIIILSAVLRLFYLDRIPNAIGGDELTYVLTGKAMLFKWTDITGLWNPFSVFLFQYPPGPSQAELPYFLQFIFSPLPFSLFNTRIIPALLSIGTTVFIFLLGRKLLNSQAGLMSAFLFAINPWSIYIGRTAYESHIASFFFLGGLAILLYAKKWWLLLSIPAFLLAFYSYIGTKLIFLPFVLISCWYSYVFIHQRKYRKFFITVSLFASFLTILFAGIIFSQGGRTSELLLPNSSDLGIQVDSIRRNSIDNPITSLFENKPILFVRIISEKLYKTFSLDYLFLTGDHFFSINRHGLFYFLDLPFIILGIIFLFVKSKKTFFFLAILALLGIMPQLFHSAKTDNFTPHLTLFFPFLLLFAGYGITEAVKKTKIKFLALIIIGVYSVFLINFLQIYFFQHPLQGHFDFNLRTLSRYTALSAQKNPVEVRTSSTESAYQKYLFYTNSLSPDMIGNRKNRTVENVTFLPCPSEDEVKKPNTTVIIDSTCEFIFKDAHISLAQLKDGGETYAIFNDKICSGINLKSYPSHITLSDFKVETLSEQQFCQTYVVNQPQP